MLNWYHETSVIYDTPLKTELLTAMSRIDKMSKDSWHFYRDLLNDYEFDHNTNAINRAFYKLWEMLDFHSDLKNYLDETLHLAEAPGSFVQVIRKLNPEGSCTAISKSSGSYASIVNHTNDIPTFHDSLLVDRQVRLLYIDLTEKVNISKIVQRKFNLITSDGGIDEGRDYSKKEPVHYQLKLGEILAILHNQALGGNCVLKVFDTFHETTIQLMYLLAKHYNTFEICKPSTSRPTNSERYMICKNFQGSDDHTHLLNTRVKDDSRLFTVPSEFRDKVLDINRTLSRYQLNFINKVMDHVDNKVFLDYKERRKEKKEFFESWLKDKKLDGYIYHIKKFRGHKR